MIRTAQPIIVLATSLFYVDGSFSSTNMVVFERSIWDGLNGKRERVSPSLTPVKHLVPANRRLMAGLRLSENAHVSWQGKQVSVWAVPDCSGITETSGYFHFISWALLNDPCLDSSTEVADTAFMAKRQGFGPPPNVVSA